MLQKAAKIQTDENVKRIEDGLKREKTLREQAEKRRYVN